MDLSVSDEQAAIQQTLDRFLIAEVPTSVVRAAEPLGFSPDLWSKLVPLGFVAMTSFSATAGGGAGLLDAALVCERLGRHLAPVPFLETVVTVRALERAKSVLADQVVDCGEVGTVALTPAVDGVARSVPAGAVAAVVVALDGDNLVAVHGPADAPSRHIRALGSIPIAHRVVRAPDWPGTIDLLAQGVAARSQYRLAVMEWRVLAAAALVGLAEGALDLGASYAKQRRQFGVPIGSFQTVGHRLADCAIELEGARLISREAAWAVDSSPLDAPRLALMAFTFASETAQHIAAEALHFHGGYGYTLEYDIHLYFTRAKAWTLVGGNPRHLYPLIADDLIGRALLEPAWISR
jgi:alkylation response protein AidB-like acyl-CoA dehydrogenase